MFIYFIPIFFFRLLSWSWKKDFNSPGFGTQPLHQDFLASDTKTCSNWMIISCPLGWKAFVIQAFIETNQTSWKTRTWNFTSSLHILAHANVHAHNVYACHKDFLWTLSLTLTLLKNIQEYICVKPCFTNNLEHRKIDGKSWRKIPNTRDTESLNAC